MKYAPYGIKPYEVGQRISPAVFERLPRHRGRVSGNRLRSPRRGRYYEINFLESRGLAQVRTSSLLGGGPRSWQSYRHRSPTGGNQKDSELANRVLTYRRERHSCSGGGHHNDAFPAFKESDRRERRKEGFSDCVHGILKLNLRRKKRALFANGPGQSVRLFSY
jgi:hypothetical protein